MVPVLFHLLKSWIFSSLADLLVQLLIKIRVDVTQGIHALLLLLKVVFELFVVLLQ